MSGVIYQRYAFTAVDDGQINLTPNATARKAALDAINGWDPSYGAIYYYNPRTATSQWIFSRQTTVTIGNHVFAK
jgi:N-acetylmuramoyl-L-alanine amidase